MTLLVWMHVAAYDSLEFCRLISPFLHFPVIMCILQLTCRYMVDAADHEKLDASKNELHSLLEKPQLAGIPVS